MNRVLSAVIWIAIAALGAFGFGMLALSRGETISAAWILVAGICTYLVAYRFYARFIAYKVFNLDARRATPAERLNNGRDFHPTNRWIAYGHHFAAISGAGPLIGPTLAAQFGFLPGTIWLIAGVVLGGAVQDFTILIASIRRDGKSLGQMAKEEVNPVAGMAAMVAIFAIMIILIAVLALVVVNALRDSPWGLFTIASTIPIALLMGWWMKAIRPGKVLETSVVGGILLLGGLVGGQWVSQNPAWAAIFTWSGTQICWAIIVYGFIASVLPVWMLLAPRDYLSTFMKIGTLLVLAGAILILLPPLKMPAVTQFASGTGPVFAGKLFPFAFITIACGAISGFHALIASGTTPKMVMRETDSVLVGYGAMLTESFVGLMAMIAAATLEPGVYFAMNVGPGTRVGRFMFQELAGHVWQPLGRLSWYPSILFSSAIVVAAWGYFVYQGVIDPLGGINSLWPLFGIANQLLAAIALCVSTTIIIKMGRIRYSWVTIAPLIFLSVATLTAGWQKVFSPDPLLGFLAHARSLANSTSADAARLIFNDNLDAALCIFFMLVVVVVIIASAREWMLVASRKKAP